MLKCNSTLPPRGTYRFDNQEIIDGGIIGGIRVELGWNYVKFHPNSTHNSTIPNTLIIRRIASSRWKGGITNDIKNF